MSRNIYDFVKEWTVWYVSGESSLKPGSKMAIGTEPGTEPFLGPDGVPCVGFIIYDPERRPIFESSLYGPLVLVDGTLRWIGHGPESILNRIYISLAESVSQDEQVSFSVYGTTLEGDPEQVAIWGANEGPPPPDPGA